MARRVNIFGRPLSYDVAVRYVDGQPVDRDRLIDPDGDDVSDATKATVVKHAQALTAGAEGNRGDANAFPLAGDLSEASTRTSDGSTPPLTVAPNPGGQFVDPASRAGRLLEGQSSIGKEPTLDAPGDASFVKKGKSKAGEVDGHRLLSNADASPDPNVSSRYVSPILSNNRFTPERTSASVVGRDKKFNPDHPPEGFGSRKRYARLGTDLSDGQVANVGPMLGLRATKELNAASSTGYGREGPSGGGASAASLLPGLAQVGAARVPTDDLSAESVLRALIEGEAGPVNVLDGQPGPNRVISLNASYGQMNNTLEQFSGLLPLGMIAAAAALTVALNVAIRAVLAVFLLITSASSSNSRKRDDVGRFIPGDSRFNPAFQKVSFPPVPIPAKLFGLQETVNPYGDAVSEGIKAFFGGDLGGQLKHVLEAPGFYVGFCRSVVRSAADLARGLEDVGRGNPIQVAENIVAFIDVIRASKVVAVMNVFAQIGDATLSQAERSDRLGNDASDLENLDGLDAMRGRQPGSLATAWGASTTRTSLLLPPAVTKAMLAGKPGALTSLLSNRSSVEFSNAAGRIPAQELALIEDTLNAEYLPFYFHDLRTNEVVSFHAFLGNLSEDFTPNYDNVDGYGRVDAVKLYRNTNRKISVQFHVAATNKEDFDGMWLKVNKLTTMVYPQWSRGTLLQDGEGNRFVQPFSQTPAASPLMRVRVGDLWTSNYSRFSLARIFGLGSDTTFKLKEFIHKTDEEAGKVRSSVQSGLEIVASNGGELPRDTVWLLEPGDYEAAANDQGALGAAVGAVASIASVVGVKVASPGRVSARLRVYTRVAVAKAINRDAYAVTLLDADGLPANLRGAQLLVSRSHLSMNDETLATLGVKEKAINDDPLTAGDNAQRITKLSDFFAADNNALVKAFEASKGRGVAAYIEGLSFDWNSVLWETALVGSRAPQMCKVTLNMAVVHDITPGIDADGFNRAPVYNVGGPSNAMTGRLPKDEGKAFTDNANKVRRSLI